MKTFLLVCLGLMAAQLAVAFHTVPFQAGVRASTMPRNLFGRDPEKERQKEEQFRIQQEILARRRDPDAMKQYFEEREFVRVASSQEAAKATIEPQRRGESNEEWKKRADEWGKNRAKELESIDEYNKKEDAKGGIPLPMASFGVSRFDGGERFDLRLPFVDAGYEDEGADVMGKITSFFSGKKEEKEQPKAAKAEKPASEATEEKKDKPFFGLF